MNGSFTLQAIIIILIANTFNIIDAATVNRGSVQALKRLDSKQQRFII